MKRRALTKDNKQETESNNTRDTIPDYSETIFLSEERNAGCAQVDTIIEQTAAWYRDIVIKKKIPQETVVFRIKLFNLIKNEFLKAALVEMEKNSKTYKKMGAKYRQSTLAYIDILKNSQYEQLIGKDLADRMITIFSDGDWHSAYGLGTMLLQLRPLLTSSFEND